MNINNIPQAVLLLMFAWATGIWFIIAESKGHKWTARFFGGVTGVLLALFVITLLG